MLYINWPGGILRDRVWVSREEDCLCFYNAVRYDNASVIDGSPRMLSNDAVNDDTRKEKPAEHPQSRHKQRKPATTSHERVTEDRIWSAEM
jgi:hypothetical protein